jgi:hypothetical protein
MSFDLEDVCDGIAARYAPGTIGTPTGALGMRASYGQAPNSLPVTPAVVVLPKTGTVVYGSGQRKSEHEIDVLFYHSRRQGDVPRSETERQRWLPYLLDALHGQVKLGLAPEVDKALPTTYAFEELSYGGDEYDGIRINVRVWVTETVSLTP